MNFAHQLFFDTEVKAPFKGALDKLGLDVYSRHQGTQIILGSFAIDDGPETVIDCANGEPAPPIFTEAWRDPSVQIVAHNAQYDRIVMMNRAGFVAPIERWYCTRARAYAHGLPGELAKLGEIFHLGDESKKDGDELIELFCEQGASPSDHLAEWLKFMEYSAFDITSLRKLYKLLPAWSFDEREQRLYQLDQRINDRGFKVDLALALKIIEQSDLAVASLNKRVQELTAGLIEKGTQRDKVRNWLNALSTHQFENMRAETLRKAARDHKAGIIELSEEQLAMIELRLLSAKSSVAKCKTALNQAGPGSRIRYAMTYGGGGRILRWSHKGFQPGNMMRPTRKKDEIEAAIEAFESGTVYAIWGDEALSVGADCTRGLIVADEGKKLSVADYSNIEGRILAWYANEQWKLKAYRDRDAGTGEDTYKLLFHQMTGIALDKIDDFLRQQGKGADLSMGYEGGVGAFLNIANAYQMDLVALAAAAPKTLPAEFMERARGSWKWAQEHGATLGLPEHIYIACAALRDSYRAANPNIKALWGNLIDCAKLAYGQPGVTFETAHGRVRMMCSTNKAWLAVEIPSGRKIMIAEPKIEMVRRQYVTEDGDVIEDEGKPSLTARKSPVWRRQPLYGGLMANLITQGFARDILGDAMLDLDAEGYPILLHVHDEIVTELDEGDPRTHKTMIEVMLRQAKRYPGLPLNAAGYTAKRFRKG